MEAIRMKVFIIFLAVLIINISFLTYQGDLGRYLRTQTTVKAIAEECAAGAALFFDEAAYGDGYLVSDQAEAIKHIDYILSTGPFAQGSAGESRITWTVLFYDDTRICRRFVNGSAAGQLDFEYPYRYTDENKKEIIIDEPSVVVTLKLDAGKIFRLPFLASEPIVRSTLYELKSKGS
jgi:hypothetical protein